MSRNNTAVTAPSPEATTLYNDRSRTGACEIDLTFIRHTDPTKMVVISRSAGYDNVSEPDIAAARELYRARVSQGYRKLDKPRYAFVGIDYCGRFTVLHTTPSAWPAVRAAS